MKTYSPIVLLCLCAALFAAGLVWLFEIQFKTGIVYAPYSSLRADPLGTMAFYESLAQMPDLTVRRDLSISGGLPEEPATAYLRLGCQPGDWRWVPDNAFRELKNFLARGGRLVIVYAPVTSEPFYFDYEDETNSVKSAHSRNGSTNAPPVSARQKKSRHGHRIYWRNLEDEWRFHEHFRELPQDDGRYSPVPVAVETGRPLPPQLAWHSGLVFTNCDPAWRVIYRRGSDPVVVERQFDHGSVVLATDAYFLSNEALFQDRHADLLAWMIGASRNVVFDEADLGTTESPGVAALMRKYRLHGLAAGLLLLAGLFIWKNATSLAPAAREAAPADFVAGRDARAGFINLLRRNIPPRDIFAVCFAEWRKSAAPAGQTAGGRMRQAEAIFAAENSAPPGRRNPVAAYQKISETLGPRHSPL